MVESLRVFYGSQMGRMRKNINWPRIDKETAVIITAAEHDHSVFDHIDTDTVTAPPGAPVSGKTEVELWKEGRPNLGAANVYVTNIGPHGDGREAGGVEFYLHVDWKSPLNIVVTITALGKVDEYIHLGQG